MVQSADNWCVLSDGRKLGYLSCGDRSGLPVFYCHGFPGSRLEVLLADRMAADHSIRLVGIDRPGYGLSDAQHGRNLKNWADDIAVLADHLGVDRFSVLGVSGGGPYALACAVKLQNRLVQVGLACSLAPIQCLGIPTGMSATNRFGLNLSAWVPSLLRTMLAPLSILLRKCPGLVLSLMTVRAKQPDRSVLRRRDIRSLMVLTFREAVRFGTAGAVSDLRLYGTPWGLDLNDIRVPVKLWHGEADHMVPAAMGRWLAAAIPDCKATFYPEHGHFSLITDEMPTMLSQFASMHRFR